MKKKVLSALLAVALFAGLAVPAFASTESTQAGDPSKVTKIEFAKSSYDIKQDKGINFDEEVRVYETNKKLVLDHNQLSWSLEGGSTAFAISGSTVTAIEKTGTATLVVKDDESGKVVAKTKINAVVNPKEKFATSYKFGSTNYKLPFATIDGDQGPTATRAAAEDFTFKVYPIPAGSSWGVNEDKVKDEVMAKVASLLKLTSTSSVPATKAKYSIDLTGVTTGDTITKAFGQTVSVAHNNDATDTAGDLVTALNGLAGFKDIFTASNASAVVTIEAKNAGAISDIDKATYTSATEGIASPTNGATVTVVNAGSDEVPASTGINYDGVNSNDDNAMEFTIPAAQLATAHTDLDVNKQVPVNTEVLNFTNQSGQNGKKVTAKTIFTPVYTKKALTIAALSNKTIEVGGTFKLGDTVKLGASDANVQKGYTFSERALDTSDVEDYAIVNTDGKVTGVAVGTNYIVVSLNNTGAEALCKVTVVEKGTLPAETSDMKLSATSATLEVGGTAYITVANAPEDGIEWAIDNSNATIVAGKGAVKIFAKKVGTATVTCTVNGVELGKIAVTVKAAGTTTPSNPGATNNPQTGDSIFAGLF